MNSAQAMHILAQLTKEPIADIEVAYAHGEQVGVPWIWIGHKLFGPVLQWGKGLNDGWQNIFSHNNFGSNYTSGGTWSGLGNRSLHLTIGDALESRELDFNRLFPHPPYGGKLANVAANTEALNQVLTSIRDVY